MKKITKIIAAIAAFVLMIGLLLFANAWVGNPISKLIATNSAEKYVAEKYSDIDLAVEKTVYNFKFSSYVVFFRSPASYDTAFSVYLDSLGKTIRDDYEYEVANNFTTWRRLDSELREIGDKLMRENLKYNVTHAIFSSVDVETDDFTNLLTKDMKLDIHNPPFGIDASITINDPDVSYEKMAEVMRAVAELCADENIPIAEYSIHIENDALVSVQDGAEARENQKIGIYNIPAELLNSENLASDLKAIDVGEN